MPGLAAFSKAGLFAAALGLSVIGLGAPRASAHEIQTVCDDDSGRCFRVVCNDEGDDCRPIHRHRFYAENEGRPDWVCNPWGGDCRPAFYDPPPPPPPVYRYHEAPAEPAFFFGFNFGR